MLIIYTCVKPSQWYLSTIAKRLLACCPLLVPQDFPEINKLDKNKTYLIYCRSGNRSRGALSVMVELGFRAVYHLSVGINGWVEEGFPITK